MGFAERNGLVKGKEIQVDGMDDILRNRLYNIVCKYWGESNMTEREVNYVVDRLGFRVGKSKDASWDRVNKIILYESNDSQWYGIYDVIEALLEMTYIDLEEIKKFNFPFATMLPEKLDGSTAEINKVLEEEKAGYRLCERRFVKIVSQAELDEVEKILNAPYHSVHMHIEKALHLYSDRKNPDYENSIKESISAVEAMCCTITGVSGSQATLGNALKQLENHGIEIHRALKEAFIKLYGYTSDADGIRHGGIDFTNASSEDAKYMLITCSAFVNYLIEKQNKVDK